MPLATLRVLTLLPDESMRRLRSRLTRPPTLRPASAFEIEAALTSSRCDLVVLDPVHVREDTFESLIALAARAGARVLLYTAVGATNACKISQAARTMPVEVVHVDTDEEPKLLNRLVQHGLDASVEARTLQGLGENIARMRPPLAATTVSLFAGGRIAESAEAFLARFDEHPRTIQTWIAKAHLTNAHDLLWCARVARVRDALANAGRTVDEIAAASNVQSSTLRDAFRRLVRLPPRRAARELSVDEYARRLVKSITRP